MQRRLSSVFLMPLSADPVIAEAVDAAIVSNSATQEQARMQLNAGLREAGLKPVAGSTWSRFLQQQLRDGVHARWRRGSRMEIEAAEKGQTVTVPKAAYLALVDAVQRLVPERE
jgi:hypothetical protein